MNKILKGLRLMAFVFLIVLAGIGIGLSGGVPIPMTKRRENKKDNIEQIDNEKGGTKENIKP